MVDGVNGAGTQVSIVPVKKVGDTSKASVVEERKDVQDARANDGAIEINEAEAQALANAVRDDLSVQTNLSLGERGQIFNEDV